MADTNYFSHDANARYDTKILRMLTKYKYGYQWYFMLLEILRMENSYRLHMDSNCTAIAMQLHETSDTIAEWLHDCIDNYHLLQLDEDGNVYSPSLVNRMSRLDQKRQKMAENANKRWSGSNGNANAEQLQSSKVKKSIVKKRKEKYSNEDVLEFEGWWCNYGKKAGDKNKVMAKYLSQSQEDRNKMLTVVNAYVKSTPDKAFRKNPMTYLNNRSWEDEIIHKSLNQINNVRSGNSQSFD